MFKTIILIAATAVLALTANAPAHASLTSTGASSTASYGTQANVGAGLVADAAAFAAPSSR